MKTKLTITIEKKDGNLELTYDRKDIEKPETTEDSLILKYIETIIRYNIDNGFASPQAQEKEGKDGDTSKEQERVFDNKNELA